MGMDRSVTRRSRPGSEIRFIQEKITSAFRQVQTQRMLIMGPRRTSPFREDRAIQVISTLIAKQVPRIYLAPLWGSDATSHKRASDSTLRVGLLAIPQGSFISGGMEKDSVPCRTDPCWGEHRGPADLPRSRHTDPVLCDQRR